MERQLHLLTYEASTNRWRIDAQTKAVGHRGLAKARAALQAAHVEAAPSPRHVVHPSSSNVRRSAA